MKALLLQTVLYVLSICNLYAQDNPINQYDQLGKKTGYWKVYYENGKTKYEGNFLNDNPVGEFKRYYPGGILQACMVYSEDSDTIRAGLFYENGKMAAEGRYINKQKDSIWNYFSAHDGHLTMKESYRNGEREGECIKLYRSEKISERIHFVGDKRQGAWEQFYQDGTMRLKGSYVNDLREGDFQAWAANGIPSVKGFYHTGMMHGKWIYYNEQGEIEITVDYVNGVMIPNKETEKRQAEFSRRVQESIGNYVEPDMPF